MSDHIDNFDIFELPSPPPADSDETIALRAEVDELCARLTDIIRTAPSQDDEEHIPEKEEWCKTFSDLKVRLLFPLSVLYTKYLTT